MPIKSPCIILIEPQMAENVGMSARAMMNCGLTEMRLVLPRENHLSDKAIASSSHAEEILYHAKVFSSVDEALADLQFVLATTARHRDQTKSVYTAEKAAMITAENTKAGNACGIMFGPERTGLRNEDICRADAIINIPLNPKHCSLNLSQAVLLAGYEYYKTQINAPDEQFITNRGVLANKEKLSGFLHFLEDELNHCYNHPHDEKREKAIVNLRNIFTRNSLTEQEINTLYGVINYIKRS